MKFGLIQFNSSWFDSSLLSSVKLILSKFGFIWYSSGLFNLKLFGWGQLIVILS